MKKTILLFYFILIATVIYAQNKECLITGQIVDSLSKNGIDNFSVRLNKANNSYQTFTNNGKFSIKVTDTGKYSIELRSINYSTKIIHFNLGGKATHLIDTIFLSQKTHSLNEVNISGGKRVNDTISFDTRLFPVDLNSFSKSLFNILPGMEIDRKMGTLKYLGSEIGKLYVDGEPFFETGSNTALEFLRSGAISKVLVYKQGEKWVANIILKPFAKRGHFAGVEGILGIPNFNGIQVTANAFNKKMRLGISGLINTFGNAKLSWNPLKQIDPPTYLGGLNNMEDFLQIRGENETTIGVPNVQLSNLTFSNRWKKEKLSVEYSNIYTINQVASTVSEKNILSEILSATNKERKKEVKQLGNSYQFEYERKLDKKSKLKISSNGILGNYQSNLVSQSRTVNELGRLVNAQSSLKDVNGKVSDIEFEINWDKQLSAKQNIEISLKRDNTVKSGNGNSTISTVLYRDGLEVSADTLRQYTQPKYRNYVTTVTFSHRYKISNKLNVDNKLLLNNNNNLSNILISGSNGNIMTVDSLLSSDTRLNGKNVRLTPTLKYNNGKTDLKFGINLLYNSYKQIEISRNEEYDDKYIRLSPNIGLTYNYRIGSSLEVAYELEPIKLSLFERQYRIQISDPLNIIVGNPNLKQGYKNNIQFSLTDINIEKQRNLTVMMNLNIIKNEVRESSTIDEFNRTVTKYINLNGNFNIIGSANYHKSYRESKISLDIILQPSVYQNVNIINEKQNINRLYGLDFFTSLSKTIENAHLKLEPMLTINRNTFANYSKTVLLQRYKAFFSATCFNELDVVTEFDYNIRNNSNLSSERENLVWNAGLSIGLFKQKNLLVSLQVNDILNKNNGYNRIITDYKTIEESHNVLKRYLGFKLFYKMSNKIGANEARYD